MNTNPNQLKKLDVSPAATLPGLSPEVRLRRQAGVVLCHVADRHMLVPAMTNKVDLDSLFLLNETGVFVWENIDGRRRVRDIGLALAKAFAIETEAATADVARFISNLLEHNLLEFSETHWL